MIAVKSTDLLLKLKAKVGSTFAEEFNELVVMTTDAIALLGHASFELSQIRREDVNQTFTRTSCGDLCSTNVPVTELLFRDEHIRATNKISNTTSSFQPLRRTFYGQNFNQNVKHHNSPFFITSDGDE